MELKQEVFNLLEEVDRTHKYSISHIYGLYNRVFKADEKYQSCASCLIRKIAQLRQWYNEHSEMTKHITNHNTSEKKRGRKRKASE